jgi:pyruvate-ferredoxin/flavodoxin oxidoreductase
MTRPATRRAQARPATPPHPGVPDLIDGARAVVAVASAAGAALDLDPAAGVAPPEDVLLLGRRHGTAGGAAAAGAAQSGLRALHFSRGEGLSALRASLAAGAGRHLPWVLHAACTATTRHARARGPGHDDLHALSDTGAFLMLARDAQQVLDLGLVAHRLAELSLVPGVVAHDDPLVTRALQEVFLPTRALAHALLGQPSDLIETPTPAQRLVWGGQRRTVPRAFDVDAPAGLGGPSGPDAWAQGAVASSAFFGEPVARLAERALQEFAALTGRQHETVTAHCMQDAEIVLVAQGGAVPLCEAVCDRLRAETRLKLGVVGVMMLRPFPGARLSSLLRGRRAVAVLERTLSPLGQGPPLMQELRALMNQALENERADGDVPHAEVAPCSSAHLPLLASVTYGLAGAPLRSGQIVAAVENLAPGGSGSRRVVTGVEFERPDTHVPRQQIRQEQVLEACPEVASLSLPPAADLDLLPTGSVSVRVIAAGRAESEGPAESLGRVLARLTGLHVRAWPDTAPARLRLPTGGRVVLSPEPVAWPGDRPRLDALVVQDPGVLRRSHAVGRVEPGGLVLVRTPLSPEALWDTLGRDVQHVLRERALSLACIAPPEAEGEACGPHQDRQTTAQLMAGALLTTADLAVRAPLPPTAEHGARAVRVEQCAALTESGPATGEVPHQPAALVVPDAPEGPAHPGHFWAHTGFSHASGQPTLVDPRAASGALPAASSGLLDMTPVRTHLPHLLAERCTACGDCWTQCPDAALRVRVTGLGDLLAAAERAAGLGADGTRLARIRKPLAQRAQRRLLADPQCTLQVALPAAYGEVADKLGLEPAARAELDAEFAGASARLEDFPLVRAAAFLEEAEARAPGLGGLLSLTVDGRSCKGCDLCVQVCPEDALVSVPQDEPALKTLEEHAALHERLPDTDERHLDGSLPRLFLRRQVAEALHGGDGACAGCGEKTALRLVLAAQHAQILPRVAARVQLLDELIDDLDAKARGLVADDADLADAAEAPDGTFDVHVDETHVATVRRLARVVRDLRALRTRLARGRAAMGASATAGCSASFGGTWPANPWSFPWTHQLVADAPAQAVGLWEGHAAAMAAECALVRRARLERDDEYDPEEHDAQFERFGWRDFDDEERALCPPVLVFGGDGALTGEGLASLSDLLAGDRPLKVVLLDNQVASECGGAAGTTAYAGQRGAENGGRPRLEPALLGLAHRGAFVLQGSPAAPAHLLDGVRRGLASPRPALFVLYAACPSEH